MSKLLLVAENSKTIQKAVELTFSAEKDLEILFAGDGQTALMMVKEKKPGVVLADYNLPGIDGYDLLAEMKQESSLSTIPVIIMNRILSYIIKDSVEGAGVTQ